MRITFFRCCCLSATFSYLSSLFFLFELPLSNAPTARSTLLSFVFSTHTKTQPTKIYTRNTTHTLLAFSIPHRVKLPQFFQPFSNLLAVFFFFSLWHLRGKTAQKKGVSSPPSLKVVFPVFHPGIFFFFLVVCRCCCCLLPARSIRTGILTRPRILIYLSKCSRQLFSRGTHILQKKKKSQDTHGSSLLFLFSSFFPFFFCPFTFYPCFLS